ncbi:hypothetical protein BI49514_02610 [Brevibacterium iodinum ATCC 49514]|uniref:Uncharacterized protein n=1 Tax=Brevibacterium iodinum ATCC 49514 TaxID=1255616 RepID=A0A2H1K222_9MICO|nr:hypothetical protein [Brevibacterium iodinum]SMX93857.1 hypothetical protein BI49514_02610 [Brevibacterium iodinum ATCC 49514]SUW11617.1 Uncharacterised protein [Brevibacterium iodinum]
MTENQNPDQNPNLDRNHAENTASGSNAADSTRRIEAQGTAGPHAGPNWATQSQPSDQGRANERVDQTTRSAPDPQAVSPEGQRPWVNPYHRTAPIAQSGGSEEPRKQKRRVPLIPAVLAGSALFVVGGLAGGAIGASAAMASKDSGTSQGPGGQNGPGGMGGQQGGAQDGGGQPNGDGMPGGQSNGGGMPGGQSNGMQGNQSGSADSGSSSDGSSSDGTSSDGSASDADGSDASAGTTSAGTDETTIENAAVTHFDRIFTGFAVLNRDE